MYSSINPTKRGTIAIAASLFVVVVFLCASAVAAASTSCTTLTYGLGLGSTDARTASQITPLQDFLFAQGDLPVGATGYFGPLTLRAVEAFQSNNGISTTGFVGPLTRAAIQEMSCGTAPVPNPVPSNNVTIYSISPVSGPVGTSVSIKGFGFTASNTVHFGSGTIGNVPVSSSIAIACTTNPSCHGGINQTLIITIPSAIGPYCAPGMACPMYMQLLTPGTYTVYVQNDNGTSNSVSFTITGTNPIPPSMGQAPTITGIDTPSTLALGSVGTWTVHASDPSGSTTNLHYTVNWGDQPTASSAFTAPSPVSSQSSATFTHVYEQAGTHTATFTVSNDSGQSSTVSSTITVTPLY